MTGWSLEATSTGTFIRDSKLMVYDGGLGVISGDDGDGSGNQHTIDNNKRKDFLIFQFSEPVRFLTAAFNTYSVNGAARDSDATLSYGTTGLGWNSGLGLNNQNMSALGNYFQGSYESLSPNNTGASNVRDVNPNEHSGNIWLIGASFANADGRIDGFKLSSLAVIPEPATWMMMIGGFGLVGAALRRRKAARPAISFG